MHTHDSGILFSPYGYKVPTKAIENFAKDAVVFRNAFCAAPTCSPSRAALLTGKFPHSVGMLGLANRGFQMKDYKLHLVNLLKVQGYYTVLSGIQHEAAHFATPEEGARIIGYDENITTDMSLRELEDKRVWDQNNTENTCRWLREKGNLNPFFLSMGFFCTHRPYPKGKTKDMGFIRTPAMYPDEPEIRKDFADHCLALESVDNCVEKVVATLQETGLYENSIIVFTTDHGIAYPFSKSSLYDSGISVAFIMRVPGSQKNGCLNEQLVSHVDLVPTLYDLLEIPKTEACDGVSFADYFQENGSLQRKRNEIFAEMNFHSSYEPARCIRTRRYKYIEYLDGSYDGQNLSNVNESITKSWYLERGLRYKKKPFKALYDLAYDTLERNNLINDEAYDSIRARLSDALYKWREETKDPLIKGGLIWERNWVVNKKTCKIPSSKNPEDYEQFYSEVPSNESGNRGD